MKYIALTFDDGRKDFIKNVVPICAHYKINVTLFYVSGFFYDDTIKERFIYEKCTNEDINYIHSIGHEIGLHSYSHSIDSYKNVDEWEKSLKDLKDLGFSPLGSATPFYFNPSKNVLSWHKRNGFKYICVGWQKKIFSLKRKFISLLYLITKNIKFLYKTKALLYSKKYKCNKLAIIKRLEIRRDTPVEYILHIVNSMKNDTLITLAFHSIYNEKETLVDDYHQGSYSQKNFEKLISELYTNGGVRFIKLEDYFLDKK